MTRVLRHRSRAWLPGAAVLFAQLTSDASEKVRKTNYERLFDEARRKVRAWEKAHVKETS